MENIRHIQHTKQYLLATVILSFTNSVLAEGFYCNWVNCNGIVQGGEWCNENRNRCEVGCGGTWCAFSVPEPPSAYCNWNQCDGEAQGGSWCNANEENCIACGNGSQWCALAYTTETPYTEQPTQQSTSPPTLPTAATPPTASPPAEPVVSEPPRSGYCNWNQCNGVEQGGSWCNESEENCLICGSGSRWCLWSPSTPGPATEAPGEPEAPTATAEALTTAPDVSSGFGYCNWNRCNGEAQGGEWCNANEQQCLACGSGSEWCSSGNEPPPAPTGAPPPGSGEATLTATHFWDCSGAACDALVLQPWDPARYRYSAYYAPVDPAEFPGGPAYGEKLWMTGAASDALSAALGPDDGCCGQDSEGIGGCGKCLLVTNPTAVNSEWKAVVMKKNRCPPWSAGCDKPHLDIAVPGYDNLQFSTANICGASGTILSKPASSACGDWYLSGESTIQACSCDALPDTTPQEVALRRGCELFTAWGWTSGDPQLTYEVVDCPTEFASLISGAFGPEGPIY